MTAKVNLALLGIAIAVAGCGKAESKKAAEVRRVRTVTVVPQTISSERSAVGEIRPRYESEIGFRITGKVTKRFVDVGTSVKTGDLLAELDDQDYRNRLTAAETDVAGAEAVLVEAQAAESRFGHLLANGNTTRANYDVALKNLRSAQARLGSAKASAKLAADQVSYCRLRADFDGIVTATGAEPGQVMNVGQMSIKLARADDTDAVFSIAEAVFAGRPPQSKRPAIVVQLLSNPKIEAVGEVREIAPVADATTRTFLVKVTLDHPPNEMRFGASIVGRLKIRSEPQVVLPGGALFDRMGKPAVWVVDPVHKTVSLRPVAVARYESDRIVLTSGLAKGDVVVTAGVNRLRDKQPVALMEGDLQ
ncbi:MAG: efflux RND transporter periplasmic adaptor subunit [Hyphomicrobiaceae bacterium]